MNSVSSKLDLLKENLEGDLKYDIVTRTIYSTDASDYKEMPAAVVWPKGISDLRKVLRYASEQKTGLTLRAAGTSIAGQVVTSGKIGRAHV